MKYRIPQLLLLVLLFTFARPTQAHDYHASIADVRFNAKNQTLEVAVKVFMDDLEDALSRHSKKKVSYSASSPEVRKHLASYLSSQLSFEVEKGKVLPQKFIGSEEDADVVWMYLEVPVQKAALTQLYIKNAVLTELFSDQMNIVNLNYKGKTESVLLQRHDTEKLVKL